MATRVRRLFKRLAWLAVICAAASLPVFWLAGNAMTGASNADVPSFGPAATEVTIASGPGITLAGSFWAGRSPGSPAILLLHGNGGNRRDVAGTAAWLNAQGYAVLAVDFRGHGRSTRSGKSFGLHESVDARAAFDWLHAKMPGSRIGVIGFSLGGAAAVLGDKGPLPADALVLECVYPDIRHAVFNRVASVTGTMPAHLIEPLLSFQSLPRYGVWPSRISPVTALRATRMPVMIVAGEADRYTPRAEAEEMYDAAPAKGKEIWILGGLSHDEVVTAEVPWFRERLLAFLDRNLRPAKTKAGPR